MISVPSGNGHIIKAYLTIELVSVRTGFLRNEGGRCIRIKIVFFSHEMRVVKK